MSSEGANTFAQIHYAHRPEILGPFLDLRLPVFRFVSLRFMILGTKGGVYGDFDTNLIKPTRDWVPQVLRTNVYAVVGIEYDQLEGNPFPRDA